MAYEHDPNRPNQPRSRLESQNNNWGLIVIALVVAGALAFIFLLLPASDDKTTPRVTENAPKIERPATTPAPTPAPPPAKAPAPTTPPANTPAPTTPAK